jgi:hypothetical protein
MLFFKNPLDALFMTYIGVPGAPFSFQQIPATCGAATRTGGSHLVGKGTSLGDAQDVQDTIPNTISKVFLAIRDVIVNILGGEKTVWCKVGSNLAT